MENGVIDLVAATSSVQENVDGFYSGFNQYLDILGLPTKSILIDKDERGVVINNIPSIVNRLTVEQKEDAMYISKFIAACGAGLFDAAINFLWNETILNLRNKIIRFDLNYFLDSIITDTKRRASFKTEDDLKKIDDWELIKGCKDTGIITEIGYKHLDYIREMRNFASAAHPNQNNIDGLQISSWLQTCIKEVLAKEPEGPVIEIKKLIHNIRNQVLTQADTPLIIGNINRLPTELVDSLLSAIFGMYTDTKAGVDIKNNIYFIAPTVWDNCSKQAKNDTALKYVTFSVNAEVDRRNLAHKFLDIVDGLSYLPKDQKVLDMDEILKSLSSAHYGYNNFYNEPIYAKALLKYVPRTGEIPEILEEKYVKVLIECSLGNGYGVSEGALEYYDSMLSLFSDRQFFIFVKLLNDSDIKNKLYNSSCLRRYKNLAEEFYDKTINMHLKEVLKYIINMNQSVLPKISEDNKFKELMKKITI